jgi:DNA-binding CsgD family transcriptional regulator
MSKILCVLYPEPEAGHPPNYIVMTGHGDVQRAVRAMKVHDFIERPFDDERLLSAIDQALAPASRVSQAREAAEARNKTAALSPREREVLDGLVAGKPNKAIAYDLGISVRTVEVHRARMLERLGTRSTAEAIRLAVIATVAPPSASAQSRPIEPQRRARVAGKSASANVTCRTTPGRPSAHSSASRSHFAKTAAAS